MKTPQEKCYPKEFVEWIKETLSEKVFEWMRSEITLLELYNYWQTNIKDKQL